MDVAKIFGDELAKSHIRYGWRPIECAGRTAVYLQFPAPGALNVSKDSEAEIYIASSSTVLRRRHCCAGADRILCPTQRRWRTSAISKQIGYP